MFRYYQSNNLHQKTIRALLLTIPFFGIISQLSPVQAQPVAPVKPTKGTNSFSPELKESINNLLAFSAQDRVCRRLVDLHVENATLGGVIARLRQILPTGSLHIEVHGDTPIKASLDLKQAKVGDVLSDLARLAGCKLYVLPDTLMIMPELQLSSAERTSFNVAKGKGAEWLREGTNWSSGSTTGNLFARAVTQEATGQDTTANEMGQLIPNTVKTTFGAFSPESQSMLQEIASNLNQRFQGYVPRNGFYVAPIHLNANSPVTISIPNPNQIAIIFPPNNPLDPSASDPKALPRGYSIGWGLGKPVR